MTMKHGVIRKQNVMDLLRAQKRLTVEQAMAALEVSESTIRRLFSQLEAEGFAIRTYGGIMLDENDSGANAYSFEATQLRNPGLKAKIGRAAEALIRPGDIVYLDSGTTVMSLSADIESCLRDGGATARKYSDVTFFTNSLVNFNLLYKYAKVYLIGGEYRDGRRDFCGYLTEEALRNLRFTRCFIGADAYSPGDGLLTSDFGTARINRMVADNSTYRVLLADSSKYGAQSVVCYSPLSRVHCLVTDGGLGREAAEAIRALGIHVLIVDDEGGDL